MNRLSEHVVKSTYQASHVRPSLAYLLHELDTLSKSISFFVSDRQIISEAELKLDGCHDGSTVSKERIRDEE